MTEKGPDHAYTEQELNLLRLALTEAAAVRSTEAERMTTELEVRKRRHATALASLRAAVETAQGNLAAAEAHNARVEKRHAYWLERFSHHCQWIAPCGRNLAPRAWRSWSRQWQT